MKKFYTILSLLLLLCSASCGSSNPDDGLDIEQLTLTEKCEGNYTCNAPDEDPFPATLEKSEESCYMGEVSLNHDGSGESPAYDEAIEWEGTNQNFQICLGSTCFSCESDSQVEDDDTKGAGYCGGSATSCRSRSRYTCSSQDGCSVRTRHKISGGTERVCRGTARSCSTYETSSGCSNQRGCHWYD